MAPVTYALLLLNLAAFALESVLSDATLSSLMLWPLDAGFRPWQLVSSAFLHADPGHLATNMFGLWMFGRPVEAATGSRRFGLLYAASLATAAITQLLITTALPDKVPTLGASGALFGVLAAFAMLFPDRTIMLLFPPIPMKAWLFVLGYGVLELWSGVSGQQPGVAHFAHLGGLAGGALLVRRWRSAARKSAPPAPQW